MLNDKELQILTLLGEAYNQFIVLPKNHPSERSEFMRAIHSTQTIVMARSAIQSHPNFFTTEEIKD